MGCDIHAFYEIKCHDYDDKERKNGIWVNADKWTINDRFYFHDAAEEGYEERKMVVDYDDRIYTGRHYFLFAILAGVRKYWSDTPVISEPRGLPDNVSAEVKAESDHWGSDGHSHSWLTLTELLNFDWEQTTQNESYVDDEDMEEFKNRVGDRIISIKQKTGYSMVVYNAYIREICKGFYENTLERLKSHLTKNPDFNGPTKVTTDDIRLVFWFDN